MSDKCPNSIFTVWGSYSFSQSSIHYVTWTKSPWRPEGGDWDWANKWYCVGVHIVCGGPFKCLHTHTCKSVLWKAVWSGTAVNRRQTGQCGDKISVSGTQFEPVVLWLICTSVGWSPRMPRVNWYHHFITSNTNKYKSSKSSLLIASSHLLLIVFPSGGQADKRLSLFWLFVAINTRLIRVPWFLWFSTLPFSL